MRARSLLVVATWFAGSFLAAVWASAAPAQPAQPAAPSAVAPPTIVINEVAWGGTEAGPADEWIELANTGALTIDLTGWRLIAADGSPDIQLHGTLGAHALFLIERSDDTVVDDVPADLVCDMHLCSFGFGLSDAGETLRLIDSSGAVIDTVNADGGPWPNDTGAGPPYPSMERVSPVAADIDANWVSHAHDGTITEAHDAEGNLIHGTPRRHNAAFMPTYMSHADLSVAIAVPATVVPGTLVTVTARLTNAGGTTATHALLSATLPTTGVAVVAADPAPHAQMDGQVVWEVGDLGPATGCDLRLTWRIGDTVAPTTILTGAALASTDRADLNPANNMTVWSTTVALSSDPPTVLVSAVLYDGYQANDRDEAIELVNTGATGADLTGWAWCKAGTPDLDCTPLPALTIPPGARVWIARDAGAFAVSFGFPPDAELPDWPGLSNAGDEVILRASLTRFVDTLVYKAGDTGVPGWSGHALRPYLNGIAGETGQLLSRIRDERTGLPIADTDTASDWIQYGGAPDIARRVAYPGWDLDRLSHPLSVTEAATVLVGIAPDNAFDVVSQTLMQARHTISIEMYSLHHPALAALLAQKAREGVRVSVLLEGDPVGVGIASPEWQTQLYACQQIEEAGGQCWFMIHETPDRIYSRYTYLHSKLLIVDDTWVAVGSQNLTVDGLPDDDKGNGTAGSRGVVLVTDAPSVVARAADLFRLDLDPVHHNDLLRWNTGYPERYGLPIMSLVDLTPVDGISATVHFTHPLIVSGSLGFEFLTAPEAALRWSDSLLGLLGRAGAGDCVYFEQLYEHVAWGTDAITAPNLRLESAIDAARRGAAVRLLLNARSFIDEVPGTSEAVQATIRYVNEIAAREHLNLRAAAGDPTLGGIHNKMVLVDLHDEGGYVHVGSLNGSEASSKVNREVALQVHSDEVHAYLARLFLNDWWQTNPIHLPLALRGYVPPPPPPDHLIVSEVAYTGYGGGEWIEVFNPTPRELDLSGHKLGDAESPDSFEGMFRFPDGTRIQPLGTLVVAVNARQVPQAHLEFYESTAEVPNMVPYPAWGSTVYPLALRNEGDHVIVLDEEDHAIDVVVWGDQGYPGITPHPGVQVSGASLERYPPTLDTDNCATDFRERYPPTPGTLPEVRSGHAR